jgi:hypothetical protein
MGHSSNILLLIDVIYVDWLDGHLRISRFSPLLSSALSHHSPQSPAILSKEPLEVPTLPPLPDKRSSTPIGADAEFSLQQKIIEAP